MSWEYVKKTFGREIQESLDNITATSVYLVKSDTNIEELWDVLSATDGITSIPQVGDAYGTTHPLSGVYCHDRYPEEIDREKALYTVVAEYSTPENSVTPSSDPTDEDWEIEWTSASTQTVATRTQQLAKQSINGPEGELIPGDKDVMNTAGDPFDPPLVIERPLAVCKLSKNYTTSSISTINEAFQSLCTINDSNIKIAGFYIYAHWAKMDDISVVPFKERGRSFVKITWTFSVDPWGQDPVVNNLGFEEIPIENPAARPALYKQKVTTGGAEASSPSRLDADGHKIKDPTEPTVRLRFSVYPARNWSALNFPEEIS